MLDIDSFKPYNDLHGHLQGDEVIRPVGARPAQALAQAVNRLPLRRRRIHRDPARHLDAEAAAAIAERLRAAVQASMTGEYIVTVSVGYACQVGTHFASADALFDAADAALYSAKELGRNCISAFPGDRRRGEPPTQTGTSATN